MSFSSIAFAALLVAQTPVAQAPAQAPATASGVASQVPATEVINQDGLVAEYFAGQGAQVSSGAVIVLGGSEGGLRGSRNLARRLASEGLPAIAVSYFGEPGQPTRLDLIPIENVERAFNWLSARPDVQGKIAVVGVSKGAELALITASRNPKIAAVVAGVPSNVVWQGIDQTGAATGSSWTANGVPLTYAPYDMSHGFTSVFDLYEDSLPAAPADSQIPVERIAGPILLVSGRADSMWPSSEMADRIAQRLVSHGFTHAVQNLSYPDAGHAVFGAPVRADTPGIQGATYLGGTVDGLVAARADSWPRVITFLREALED